MSSIEETNVHLKMFIVSLYSLYKVSTVTQLAKIFKKSRQQLYRDFHSEDVMRQLVAAAKEETGVSVEDVWPPERRFESKQKARSFTALPRAEPREIPVLSCVQCGNWRQPTDLSYPPGVADRYEPGVTRDPNAFYMIASGDSMTGADIEEGDLLLVEPSRDIYDGQIVLVVGMDSGCTVKRYFQESDGIRLEPENPAYETIRLTQAWMENERVQIYRITKRVRTKEL